MTPDETTQLTVWPGACLRLDRVLPARVPAPRLQVEQGAVWVTWPGEPTDHFLAAGASLALPARCDGLLIETEPRLAAGPARVRVLVGQAQPLDCRSPCPPLPPSHRWFPRRPWPPTRLSMSR